MGRAGRCACCGRWKSKCKRINLLQPEKVVPAAKKVKRARGRKRVVAVTWREQKKENCEEQYRKYEAEWLQKEAEAAPTQSAFLAKGCGKKYACWGDGRASSNIMCGTDWGDDHRLLCLDCQADILFQEWGPMGDWGCAQLIWDPLHYRSLSRPGFYDYEGSRLCSRTGWTPVPALFVPLCHQHEKWITSAEKLARRFAEYFRHLLEENLNKLVAEKPTRPWPTRKAGVAVEEVAITRDAMKKQLVVLAQREIELTQREADLKQKEKDLYVAWQLATKKEELPVQTAPVNIKHLESAMFPVPLILTGVYFLVQNERVVYVGKTTRGFERIHSHVKDRTKRFNQVWFLPVAEASLDETERNWIQELRPKFNKAGKPSNGAAT